MASTRAWSIYLSLFRWGCYRLPKTTKLFSKTNEKSKLIAKKQNTDKIIIFVHAAQQHWPENCGQPWQLIRTPSHHCAVAQAGKVSLIKICCMPAS